MQRVVFESVIKEYAYERELRLKRDFFNYWKGLKQDTTRVINKLSFRISDGETVGLIGPNGVGKTTILRLIAGITFPDSGAIKVLGRVAPLIELGAGFHHDFTGRENMYLNGVILGMTLDEVKSLEKTIITFAGKKVADFIDTPIRKYSLGMKARLAFSIAIHSDPDILLVDESLSVGDVEFQEQCIHKLEELKQQGKTIIIASHNHDFLRTFCTRILDLGKKRR